MLPGMREEWQPTDIEGVYVRRVVAHDDARGSFRELWRSSWTDPLGAGEFVQANLSRSTAGVLRGLHFHLRQADLWLVLRGRVHVALVDVRPLLRGSQGSPLTTHIELADDAALLIPAGVAHGFWALSDVDLVYLVSNEYDGTDEHGFGWNDPALEQGWPEGRPILSPRDESAPSIAEAVRRALEQGLPPELDAWKPQAGLDSASRRP
jgi:dTDP-4-dehydrorhamnose 3,5-epimerase